MLISDIDLRYYTNAIERAIALLRQGQSKDALKVLQAALDQKLVTSFEQGDEDTDLELVIDPRSEETPKCWIEENHLVIDDKNWDIDQSFMELLIQSIRYNLSQQAGVDVVRKEATFLIKKGVEVGRITKKIKP